MRIFDIINEGPLPAITNPDEIGVVHGLHTNTEEPNVNTPGVTAVKGFRKIGHGAEASVFHTDSSPEVVKVLGTPQSIKNNPYLQYVLMSKRHAHENPFLPRIISIDTAGSVDNIDYEGGIEKRNIFVVKMEPLAEINELSISELKIIYELAFGEVYSYYGDDNEVIIDSMVRNLNSLLWAKNSAPGLNKNMLAVLRLIVKIKKQIPGTMCDIHNGNIMARRTPYGPQLVITDPLYKYT